MKHLSGQFEFDCQQVVHDGSFKKYIFFYSAFINCEFNVKNIFLNL